MSLNLDTTSLLTSGWSLVLASVMVATGGLAFSLATGGLVSWLISARRMRSAHRIVRSAGLHRSAARADLVAYARWVPRWLPGWLVAPASASRIRLTRVLGGRFAKEIEARLRYEPSSDQLKLETWNLANHLCSAVGVLGVVITVALSVISGWRAAPAGIALGVLGFFLSARVPWILAQRWLSRRTEEANAELPVLIDTVSLCTRAGMSFDQSLDLYARRFDGQLSHMLIEAGDVWRSGIATRTHELDRLGQRVESPSVEGFFSAVVQSMDLGTPLAAALDAQAGEIRAHRHAVLEERISKLPVKMLIPIGLFTLPAMLILLLAPITIQVIAGLG